MGPIEKFIPAISLLGTLCEVFEDIDTQGLGAMVTPIQGLVLGAALLFTTKKIIELAVDKFGSDHMKNASKSTPWLIAPAFTLGMMALTGIITAVSTTAIAVALVSSVFFYYPQLSLNDLKLMNSEFTFDSIAGMEDVKKKLSEEVISPIKNQKLYAEYGVGHPRGILFHGEPGCGKTLFAQAVAGELKLPFMTITAGDIASSFIHGNVGAIRKIFTEAISKSPCVLFMDEMDGIARKRQSGGSGSHSLYLNEEITELITQIDKAIAANVIIIGATNEPDLLDSAIVRRGRFDTKIAISVPDETSRRKLFEFYLKSHHTKDIEYEKLAERSRGCTCSDIKSMVEAAAKKALSQALSNTTKNPVPITMEMLMQTAAPVVV